MTNREVIERFLGNKEGKTANLLSTGNSLINYVTEIAYWKNGELFLNKTKYSVTTSKIQSKLFYLAEQRGNVTYYESQEIFRGKLYWR